MGHRRLVCSQVGSAHTASLDKSAPAAFRATSIPGLTSLGEAFGIGRAFLGAFFNPESHKGPERVDVAYRDRVFSLDAFNAIGNCTL